jgi:hypothetical protein
LEEKLVMPIKRYKPEQIVTMLRQIEVNLARHFTGLRLASVHLSKVLTNDATAATYFPGVEVAVLPA